MKKILIFISITFFFTMSYCGVDAATITRPINSLGLVGYWTFDGKDMTPRVMDVSGNGYNGSLVGQTSTSTSIGKIGQALYFDGVDDTVSVPDTTNLDLTADFTIATWFKTTSVDALDALYSKGSNSVQFSLGGFGGTQGFTICNNQVTCPFADQGTYVPGVWQHVVATRQGNLWSLYVNGVYVTSTTNSTSIGNSTASVNIGYDNAAAGRYFNGYLDDYRIYTRALSATEISGLYNSGSVKIAETKSKGTLSSGLVGHWTFDGKDMTPRVMDMSGNGNHGSINGQVSTTTVVGKIGQAIYFDGGNDYIDLGSSSLFAPSRFTISGWIKPTDSSTLYNYIFSNARDCCDSNNGINMGVVSNKVRVQIWNTTSDSLSSIASVPSGEWSFVTASYDGATLKVYLNGVLDNSSASALDVGSPATYSTTVGTLSYAAGNFMMNGSVDDIRLYNRVLSDAEIKQLYSLGESKMNDSQNTKGGTLNSGLTALWSFDGKDMTPRVMDRSGNGYNGTISGQTSTTTTIGKMGQALSFDGVDDYIQIPDAAFGSYPTSGNNSSYDRTFSIWFKTTSGGVIMGQSDSATPPTSPTSFVPALYIANSGTVYGSMFWHNNVSNQNISSSGYNDDRWHHLVNTYASGGLESLYLDGVLIDTQTFDQYGYTGDYNYFLGTGFGNTWPSLTNAYHYFSGSLDEMRIYSRSLSATEVKQLYNMGR